MLDRFNRKINYLRISVTDQCNLRCVYCVPKKKFGCIDRKSVLSAGEIFRITEKASALGIDKVRLTGGEPLVRDDIVELVSMLSRLNGIRDLAMTTNGILLAGFAGALALAGLHRLNISLDTTDPARYAELTGGGDLSLVLGGIEAARRAGFSPIKLNCIVQESSAENNARQVAVFAENNGLEVRFIRQMDLEKGLFWPVEGGTGGSCRQCNRLRLSCDGRLFPCLFSDLAFPVTRLGVEEAFRRALQAKPLSGSHSTDKSFTAIGG